MPSLNYFQTNYSAGIISPLLYARVEIEKYRNGVQEMENFIVQRYGGAKKRGGTRYINEVKDSTKAVRLVRFVFSVTQAYILEFGDLYIRVYTNGGRVGTVEVATPYTQSDIFDLQFAQSADVLYIAHPDYAPRQFTRTGATTFTLTTVSFEDGPFLEINTTGTKLTPSYRADAANSPGAASTTTTLEAGSAVADLFDGDKGSIVVFEAQAGEATYDFTGTTALAVDAYWVTAAPAANVAPSTWTFQGFDGSTWITLDSQQGQTGWTGGETRFYEFSNTTNYQSYRLAWTGQNDNNFVITQMAEIGMHLAPASQAPVVLTASSTTGINDDTGFQTSDVGRQIRLLASDGRWRWAEITARNSTTSVDVTIYDHSLPDITPITNWRLGAWSDQTGWPACVGFYEGRLAFARTDDQPQTVWLSEVDDFTSFSVSDPLVDSDAITATIFSEEVNEIQWISESTDLFVGTTAAIRTLGPNTATGVFTPTNLRQKRETTYGASGVQPVRVGNVGLYSGYYRKDLREIAYSFETDGYSSQDLSILSESVLNAGVKEIAYSQNPDSVVWICLDDGSLVGMTYERDQQVVAFHEHTIGGTSVFVESVETIPGSEADEVWLLVRRTINGTSKRFIERLSAGYISGAAITTATYLDCHLTYSGSSTSTLTGLSHLNGASVYVWGTGGKQGPFTVSGGSISLTSAVTAACVGFAYTGVIETLSPEAAAAGGTAQTRFGRISEAFLRVHESQDGSVGWTDGTQEDLEYPVSDLTLYSGDVRVPVEMGWDRGKRMRIEHDEPTPFYILGMISELKVNG